MKNNRNLFIAMLLLCASCSDTKENNEAAIQKMNDQSLECIRIMNKADAKKNVALTNGDAAAAAGFQKTMDSAARANVMIGQQLSELQAK